MRFLRQIRSRVTYANVVATLALFIALGGSSYAVLRVDSRSIVDNSVRSRDLRNGDVRGRDVRESSLAKVPRARLADRLGEGERAKLVLRCPDGTRLAAGLCFDLQPRQADNYAGALRGCSASNQGNRRLPTDAELNAFLGTGGQITPTGELTATANKDPDPGTFANVTLVTDSGEFQFVPAAAEHPYRCVTGPING